FSRVNQSYHRFLTSSAKTYSSEVVFSNGRKIEISVGQLAKFADACAVVKNGETAIMCTAISKQKPSTTASFLPLTVDYRLKSSAAGRIPTNMMRREFGTTERETLSARLVDRSIRPLFPKEFRCDTQLVCNVLSIDSMNKPDVDAINAASAALHLSDIPWNGPIGAVRVGMDGQEGNVITNPTKRELKDSPLDLIVAATKQNLVVMLEGKGNVVYIQDLLKAIKHGTREAQLIITQIEKMRKELALSLKQKRNSQFESVKKLEITEEVKDAISTMSSIKIRNIFKDSSHDKISRDNALNSLRQEIAENIWASFPDHDLTQINETINEFIAKEFRSVILDENRRCDGRDFDELRNISCQVDLFRPLHGSSLFTRGQTQVLCTVTLDSKDSALKLDTLTALDSGIKEKNFFLHYEFPPYAIGEIGRVGIVNRRELGHGALAEKGLLPIIPSNYPFTIRLNSEVLESNGSSSMATVCGGSMALLDAGVPISSIAAGVAIGLVTKSKNDDTKHIEDYRILTDQLGIEDYMGDMDMKVAGTKKGFTSIQTDVKVPGLPLKIINECLLKSVEAKSKIIDIMSQCIDAPRDVKKDSWPVCEQLTIESHQRSRIMGPGGINFKKIFLETGVQITNIEDTSYELFAPSKSALDEAKEWIEQLRMTERIPELEFGAIYTAKIVELREIGVMVTLYPSMPPALLHNSQLDQRKVAHPSALGLSVGQEIPVKYFGRDPVSGLMRLSRKVLQSPASAIVKNLDRKPDSIAS
ncbi:CLUMA_CG020178, isoform A, partial [Clunio marinus]